MAIDAYSICPCHQNQKIKFCCGKEIVADLNQILDKYHQGRELAALNDIERAIRKLGPKNCFLGLKTRILLDRNEIEKAAEANQLVLEADPANFLGLCHQVMIDFHLNQIEEGLERFQDCLEAVTGDQIPGSMLSLWKTVAIGLIVKGHLIAARSYLALGDYLFQGEDPDLRSISSRMNEFPDENQLMKRWFQLLPVPKNQTQEDWFRKYQAIQALVERGQFRRGFKLLKKLDATYPNQPVLIYAKAVTALLTLQYESAIDALRYYSRMPAVDQFKAVEAEALAQLLEEPSDEDYSDLVLVTFDINDFNVALERLTACEKLSETKVNASMYNDGTPLPRNCFFLLDKIKITAAELQQAGDIDKMPAVLGLSELYGKQTDRPARIEIELNCTAAFETALEMLRDLLKDLVIGETSKKVGQTHTMDLLLDNNSYSPPGQDFEMYQRFSYRNLVNTFRQRFLVYRTSILDSLTVTEASTKPELRISLLALMVRISMAPINSFIDLSVTLDELADELGISKLSARDLEGRDIWNLSPLEREYLKLENLSDQELVVFYQFSNEISQIRCIRRAIEELLQRPSQTLVPQYHLNEHLGLLSNDSARGLELLAKARQEARDANQSLGPFLVREFEYRLKYQLFDKLPDLMQTLESKYLDDPQTRFQFANVLKKFGLINPADAAQDAIAEMPSDVLDQSALLASSDDSLLIASPSNSDQAQPSKLWLPE